MSSMQFSSFSVRRKKLARNLKMHERKENLSISFLLNCEISRVLADTLCVFQYQNYTISLTQETLLWQLQGRLYYCPNSNPFMDTG